jgi:hypothetical protein
VLELEERWNGEGGGGGSEGDFGSDREV